MVRDTAARRADVILKNREMSDNAQRIYPRQRRRHLAILLPDLRGGGAERVSVHLANGLCERGYQVDVVLFTATGVFMTDLHPGVRIVDLGVQRARWAISPLARYFRTSKPDAVLACMWPLTSLAILARGLAMSRSRLIVAEHTTWSMSELVRTPFARWVVRTSMKLTFPHADTVVCVSRGAADDLAEFTKLDRRLFKVIYNPVAGETAPLGRDPRGPAEWWSGPHHRILAVGTLKEVKDYSTLLRAFAALRERLPARLLILGEGACRPALEEEARQLGVSSEVFLPGFVRDVAAYYAHAHLHVLSSVAEGLPTVIIEALAAGTPVVSTNCPSGPREILRDGQFGRLVPVKDPGALAQAMHEWLLRTHDTAALKLRAQDFSIDAAVTKYESVLFPGESGHSGVPEPEAVEAAPEVSETFGRESAHRAHASFRGRAE